MLQKLNNNVKNLFIKISVLIGLQFSKNYSCGVTSKMKLINKINNSEIKCISSSKDRYKRYLATCYKDKINLK